MRLCRPSHLPPPGTTHAPREVQGLTWPLQQKQRHSWKSFCLDSLRASPSTIISIKMLSLLVCCFFLHAQNGRWALGFYYKPFISPSLCVQICVFEEASLVSLDICLSFYPLPRIVSQMLCDRSTPSYQSSSTLTQPQLLRHIWLLNKNKISRGAAGKFINPFA